MVVIQEVHVCEYCGDAHSSEQEAERCELGHEVDNEVGALAAVREVAREKVMRDVIRWLKRSQEYADPVFGMQECPRCDRRVHETWMECPSCHVLLHDHSTGGMLACAHCDNTSLQIVRKRGVVKGLGALCPECGNFVAHGRGQFGEHLDTDSAGHAWVDTPEDGPRE